MSDSVEYMKNQARLALEKGDKQSSAVLTLCAGFLETVEEADSLRHRLAEATRKLEEARKDAERWAEFMRNTKFSIWYWCGSGKAPNKPISNAEAIALIDQAIEQGKGGDDGQA
jgi:hypothetical protein